MKVAIIGKGKVGKAVGAGLTRTGHDVRYGHRDPQEPVGAAAEWGELIVVAVPYPQLSSAAREVGRRADGKIVIDTTNAIGPDGGPATGCSTSAAEELQGMLPKAKIVKAFNTVFAQNQSTGKVGGQPLSAFVAGDDPGAKRAVMDLTRGIGFEPIDCGPLSAARQLESLGLQIVALGYGQGMGTDIGYRLVKGP